MRKGPWIVTATCEGHGLVGEERLVSDLFKERLTPYWRASAQKHHDICRLALTIKWVNGETGEEIVETLDEQPKSRGVKFERLRELATLGRGELSAEDAQSKIRYTEIAAMARELVRHRAHAVENFFIDCDMEEVEDRMATMSDEEVRTELHEAGITDADVSQGVRNIKHLVRASLERNEAYREIERLKQLLVEMGIDVADKPKE
jgi:hypothetical protein